MDGRSTGKLFSDVSDFKVIRKKRNDVLNKLLISAKEDPVSQFQLGAKYYIGDGVEQNYEEAAKWFMMAAKQGYSQAQYNLAVMYEDGEGVKENIDEALKWYKKSAEQGNNDAIEALKELGYESNDYLKRDTSKLDKNIITNLPDNENQETIEESIDLYNIGIQEYNQKKFFKAFDYFTKSAELGNPLAQYYLGRMYAEGQAVKQDFDEAIKWYRTSSIKGCEAAKKALKNIEIKIKNNINIRQEKSTKQEKSTIQEDKKIGPVELYNLGIQDYNQKKFFKAFNSFTKSAELGHSLAQYYLGLMYAEGKAVKQNLEEAKKWFQKSSAQGNNDSIEALKKISLNVKKEPVTSEEQYEFALGYYKEKIYSEAFKWFKKSSDQGNNNSLYYLGMMYQKGEGIDRNIEEAKNLYQKSSLGGCVEAQIALEELENNLKNNNITNNRQDNPKTQQVNKESIDLYNLGIQDYSQKMFFKAFNSFKKSAELGNPLSQYYLGIMYAQGKAVEQDFEEAKRWFQKSFLNGCKEAQKALDKLANIVNLPVNEKKEPVTPEEQYKFASECYKAKKYDEALKLFRKSAEQGYYKASYAIGLMYKNGEGVRQDIEEAFKWFGKYVEKATDKEQYNFGMKYYNGNPVKQNFKEAFKWFQKSAEQGNAKAQYNLGVMYEDGDGVEENIEESMKWYKKAADQGDEDAKEALKELENKQNSVTNLKRGNTNIQQYTNKESIDLYNLGLQDYNQKKFFKAFNSFIKSAELGYPLSQYYLGIMYADGKAVKQNFEESKKWFQRSLLGGCKEAQKALDKLANIVNLPVNEKKEESHKPVTVNLKKNTYSPKEDKTKFDDTAALYLQGLNYYNSKEPNYKEAFLCFLQAAEKGNITAQYNLAVMYEDGLGVPVNNQEAIKWYRKVAEQGDEDAIEALKDLENQEEKKRSRT